MHVSWNECHLTKAFTASFFDTSYIIIMYYDRNIDKWGPVSISTRFSVNPNRHPKPRLFLLAVPFVSCAPVCQCNVCVSTHVPECACVGEFLGCMCNFSVLPLLWTRLCFQQPPSVCVCVRERKSVCVIYYTVHLIHVIKYNVKDVET